MKEKKKCRSNRVASVELLGAAAEYERAGKALVAATKRAIGNGQVPRVAAAAWRVLTHNVKVTGAEPASSAERPR